MGPMSWITAAAKVQGKTRNQLILEIAKTYYPRHIAKPLADHLCITEHAVKSYITGRRYPKNPVIRRKLKDLGIEFDCNFTKYIFYKDDEELCRGTIEECAEHMGISISTARGYTSPYSHKKNKGNAVMGFKMEES